MYIPWTGHDSPTHGLEPDGGVRPALGAPRTLLLAGPGSVTEALARAVWAAGGQRTAVHIVTPTTVHRFIRQLRSGSCLPIGGRVLVAQCMLLAGMEPPGWNPHPRALLPLMAHAPRVTTASAALLWSTPVFVRPVNPNLFQGCVIRPAVAAATKAPPCCTIERLLGLPRKEPIWAATPLPIASVWRYFVVGGDLLGHCLVEGGPGREPQLPEVSAILAAAPTGVPFALDIAVLEDGSTTLLRTRDAWTLDFPAGAGADAPHPLDFVGMLWMRWQQLRAAPAG